MSGFAGAALTSPLTLAASHKPQRPKRLQLRNLHTNEAVDSIYWADGHYQLDALEDLNRCLRDHRSGQVTQMDTLLLDNLYDLQQQMQHRGEIHIISGYRSPKTNNLLRQQGHGVAKKSFHMSGRAIDLRLPNQKLSQVRKAALQLRSGGVGYYPKSDFLHLDTGRVRQWG